PGDEPLQIALLLVAHAVVRHRLRPTPSIHGRRTLSFGIGLDEARPVPSREPEGHPGGAPASNSDPDNEKRSGRGFARRASSIHPSPVLWAAVIRTQASGWRFLMCGLPGDKPCHINT